MMNFENIKVAMMTRVNALVKFPTFDLTLKGAGFWSVKYGGGILPILRKRSLTPPNFILEQQTVSHMKAEVFS